MVEAPFLRRDSSRRGGFTLIEVVVALAIFVFGAVAIIRIFPSALGVIQNSGDRLTAININRSRLTTYTREPNLVPDWIYDDRSQAPLYAQSWRDGIVGSVAGSPRRNNSIPRGTISGGNDSGGFSTDLETSYQASSLDHYKRIIGEKHIVPANGIVPLQFRYSGNPSILKENVISGVTVDPTNGTLDFSNATDETGSPYVPTPVTVPQTIPLDIIYASYRWIDSSSPVERTWGVDEERLNPPTPLPLPASQSVLLYKVARYSATAKPVKGPITVRVRRPVTDVPFLTGQLGLLDFKDTTATQPAPPAAPILFASTPAGTKLSFDYSVDDWRWLTYDSTPNIIRQNDTSQFRTVKLPVQLLDTNLPKFVYTYFPTADPNKSIRDNDMRTDSLFDIDPKPSQVTFDTNTVNNPPSPSSFIPTSRIVYRTSDNWANQLSIAARSYYLTYPFVTSSAEPWRDCSLDSNNPARNFLYFQPSEAGKTVSVTYSYIESNVEKDVSNRILTIDNTIFDTADFTPALGLPNDLVIGGRISRLELTGINGQPLTNVISIRSIKGVSIQSRTAWLDGNAFNQASSVAFRQGNN